MNSATLSRLDSGCLESLRSYPTLATVAAEVLWHANRCEEPLGFLALALPQIAASFAADYVAITLAAEGRWNLSAESGKARSLPVDLLSEAADRDAPRAQGDWLAAPLAPRTSGGEFLLAHTIAATDASKASFSDGSRAIILGHLAGVLREGLAAVRLRDQNQRRIGRLEAILTIANQWNRTHEVQPLLNQMAEAATRLMRADRASIFLWDKPNRLLVGRPALGVKEGELKIPDDRGVVGQVVQTGQPLRVDAATQPAAIDRQVDAQLHYQTRTLLCVPLRGSSGELFGAFELINKLTGVFTQEDEDALVELASHAAVALENAQDRQNLLSTNRQIAEAAAERVRLIGNSPAIDALRSIIRRVADTDLAVLILGENGTGKEVVAQGIHYLSRRRDQPFIAINCAAIPETLAESELFGHERGAFTDAHDARAGKFELAAGGTLFLDEIGDLTLGGQAKLLRVLEEKTFVRVGGSVPLHTDARVLAATNQKLVDMVRQKRFREDLYFRLNVVTLDLPPLRERSGDVMLLAEHFLSDFCRKARRQVPVFTAAAKKRLSEHLWPGNVRELRNLMERLAYLSTEEQIDVDDLAFILSPHGEKALVSDLSSPLSDATDRFQIEYIRRVIEQSSGNISQAATRLGLHRSNLYRKMRQLGMNPEE